MHLEPEQSAATPSSPDLVRSVRTKGEVVADAASPPEMTSRMTLTRGLKGAETMAAEAAVDVHSQTTIFQMKTRRYQYVAPTPTSVDPLTAGGRPPKRALT